MRKRAQYSAEFKENLLAKALAPNAPCAVELASRAGIPPATLRTWIHMNKHNKVTRLDITVPLRPKDITAEAKLQAVFDTLNVTEEERSTYCRKNGFYIYNLNEWKQQLLAGLKPVDNKNDKAEYRQLVMDNKNLRHELTRKDKALAEASALLILKKKSELTLGGRRGRLITAADKIEAIRLIQETCDAGCRIKSACKMLKIDIRTLQRWQKEDNHADKRGGPNTTPANKLTDAERMSILKVANSAEYCNQSPSQIVPHLADQEIYIASESSFYRVLKQDGQMKHRSSSQPRTHRKPAELVALKPNQVWSWDISYLPSSILGKFFYLYLFLDIFSRKIVGFHVFEKESAEYAAEVVSKAYLVEGLSAGEVTLHSDNGGPMKGSTMLAMLQNLGVMPSFSRPSVSDDNPFSESLFRTLKYCPLYPTKPFSSIEEAQAWVITFVDWYNNVHQHSGINFVTPNARHQGLDKVILEKRMSVYEVARQENPNRWSRKIRNWEVAGAVYLNPKHTKKKVA